MLVVTATLSGIGQVGTASLSSRTAEDQAAGAIVPRDSAAAAIVAADSRVAIVGYRIDAANLDRCPLPGFAPGLVLQAADQFVRPSRDAARRAFGLGDHVAVSAIVPGSPAERAGLVPGDELLAVGGRSLPRVPLDRSGASYASVKAALDAVDAAAPGRDRLVLTIRRGGRETTATMPVVAGCAVRVQLVPSPDINGFADDRYATITTALERFAADDDALALFLGHELAHAYLRHAARLDRAAPLHELFGRALLPARTVLETEREADRLGMILAARAGYDVSGAPTFWRRLGAATSDGAFARTHPGTDERVAAATQEAAEIRRRQQQGLPL